MGLIWLLGPFREFELRPRAFTFDYPWKLPEPDAWARFTAWSLYALHQVGVWYLIYKGQSMKLRYVNGLHWVNVQMLGWNWPVHRPAYPADLALLRRPGPGCARSKRAGLGGNDALRGPGNGERPARTVFRQTRALPQGVSASRHASTTVITSPGLSPTPSGTTPSRPRPGT